MNIKVIIASCGLIIFLSACSSQNVLTEEERRIQDAASEAVTGLLSLLRVMLLNEQQ